MITIVLVLLVLVFSNAFTYVQAYNAGYEEGVDIMIDDDEDFI